MTTATGSRDDVIALLRQVSLFATLSDDLLNTVARACESVRLDAGNWLFRQGQPEDGLYILASGRLEIVMEGAAGTEAIVSDLRPGDTYAIPSHVPHHVVVGPDGCTVVDVFAPVREDWKKLERLEPAKPNWP